MTLLLDDADVKASISLDRLVDEVAAALARQSSGNVHTVPRVNLPESPGPGDGFLRVMPVILPDQDLMGLKAFGGNKAAGYRYLIALWGLESGELLTLMDAGYLTAVRTGAVTAAATRTMTAGRGFEEVGVIGSGLEARTNLAAICAVMDIKSAMVFSPNPAKRARFAEQMGPELGIEVTAVDHPEAAAASPLVLVATNTGPGTDRVALEAGWLADEGHVSTIGSTMISLREVDAGTFGRSDLIVVDTEHADRESGDLADARETGQWDLAKVRTLPDLLADTAFEAAPFARTVFKSVGTAVQDIVAAKMVYDAALASGRGERKDLLAPHFV